jgi:hypothetical protein
MGVADYFNKIIIEHSLVHNFESIFSCNIHDLLTRGGDFPEVNIVKKSRNLLRELMVMNFSNYDYNFHF